VLYVSSTNEPDILKIKILSQKIFKALVDGKPVATNFTMNHLLPAMGITSDMKFIVDTTYKA
jgi:hypothetical protein